MFVVIKTVGQLRKYLNAKIASQGAMACEMAECLELSTQAQWYTYHGVNYMVATQAAFLASNLLDAVSKLNDDDKLSCWLTEQAKTEALKNVKIASRSTSLSFNIMEDAARAFWVELYNALKG